MSSWDTNPWGNFCDPYWELICHYKWQPGTSEIFTPPEIVVGIHFHEQHGTKTIPIFLSTDSEASWLLLPGLVSLLSGNTVQPENISTQRYTKVSLLAAYNFIHNFDIICFSETFLNSETAVIDPDLEITDYNMHGTEHLSNCKR